METPYVIYIIATDNIFIDPCQAMVLKASTFFMLIGSDLYDGFDYLPAYFHIFLHYADFRSVVLELKGKIVSRTDQFI